MKQDESILCMIGVFFREYKTNHIIISILLLLHKVIVKYNIQYTLQYLYICVLSGDTQMQIKHTSQMCICAKIIRFANVKKFSYLCSVFL